MSPLLFETSLKQYMYTDLYFFCLNYPFKSLLFWQTDVMLLPSQCHNKMQQKQMGSMNRLRMRIFPAGMVWLHALVPHILPHGLQWLWPGTHQPPSPPVLIMEKVHVFLAPWCLQYAVALKTCPSFLTLDVIDSEAPTYRTSSNGTRLRPGHALGDCDGWSLDIYRPVF